MAGKRGSKKAPVISKARRRTIIGVFVALVAMLLLPTLYCSIAARIVHVKRATLSSADLPTSFDGIRVAFVSDIDIVGLTSPEGAARAIMRLQKLNPDILLLGGDYLGESVTTDADEARGSAKRRAFFAALKDFSAPLGKFAIAGKNESAETLMNEAALGGFKLLADERIDIYSGSAKITLVGLRDKSTESISLSAMGQSFARGEFVIVVAHDPARISELVTTEASDIGAWADLALAGHNHGGQAKLFGKLALNPTPEQARFLSGNYEVAGTHILVSEGLGCEWLNLRLNTQAQAHLITLRAK